MPRYKKQELIPHDCVICGDPLIIRENEAHNKFNKRTVCSKPKKCYVELHKEALRKNYPDKSKLCEYCNKEFFKRRNSESQCEWEVRRFCSRKCRSKNKRKNTIIKCKSIICTWCKKKKNPHKKTTNHIYIKKWNARTHCSKECVTKYLAFILKHGHMYCKQCSNKIFPNKSMTELSWKKVKYCSRQCASTYRQENLIDRPKENPSKLKPWQGRDDYLKRLALQHIEKHGEGNLPNTEYFDDEGKKKEANHYQIYTDF